MAGDRDEESVSRHLDRQPSGSDSAEQMPTRMSLAMTTHTHPLQKLIAAMAVAALLPGSATAPGTGDPTPPGSLGIVPRDRHSFRPDEPRAANRRHGDRHRTPSGSRTCRSELRSKRSSPIRFLLLSMNRQPLPTGDSGNAEAAARTPISNCIAMAPRSTRSRRSLLPTATAASLLRMSTRELRYWVLTETRRMTTAFP